MGQLLQALESLYSPQQLQDLARVRDALKANPESLDTHSREVRQENQSGQR